MSKESLLFAEACRRFSETLTSLADALETYHQDGVPEETQAETGNFKMKNIKETHSCRKHTARIS